MYRLVSRPETRVSQSFFFTGGTARFQATPTAGSSGHGLSPSMPSGATHNPKEIDQLRSELEFYKKEVFVQRSHSFPRIETRLNFTIAVIRHQSIRDWVSLLPSGPKCLHFHAVFRKIWSNSMLTPRPPPFWEILDPPLLSQPLRMTAGEFCWTFF